VQASRPRNRNETQKRHGGIYRNPEAVYKRNPIWHVAGSRGMADARNDPERLVYGRTRSGAVSRTKRQKTNLQNPGENP